MEKRERTGSMQSGRMGRQTTVGIVWLVGVCLLIWIPQGVESDDRRDEEKSAATENFIAIHDRSSPEYDDECTTCHTGVLTAKSLDPAIPSAHVAKLPSVPGKKTNDKCVFCHRTVDLRQASSGNLRRHVDVALCTLCHGPFGPGAQYYQAGLSPDQPDGEVLYGLVCASCHRDLGNSEVKGESAREIQKAINENEGGMRPLAVLSPQEIQAIAEALARVAR